nr:hypothetical protein [Tanacetum cinerariifolium]
MRQRRWIELFSDYDCEIRYHSGKANVVADELNRKERLKPRRVRAMSMKIYLGLKVKILEAPGEKALGTSLDMSTAYHLQTDRQSERTIQTLEDMLRACMIGFRIGWVEHSPLTKSAHFLPIHEDYKMEKLVRIYINEIVARHDVPVSIMSDYDSRFTSRVSVLSRLKDTLRACVIDFRALNGKKCRSPMIWAEVGESQLIGPKIIQETTENITHIKERLKTARDCQKSYANKRRKPLELNADVCYLKCRSGRVLCISGLSSIHDTFHMSSLKKCLADANLQVPLEELKVDDKLHFVEEPIEIVERKVKKPKRKIIPIVKVHWNSKRGAEFTWE